MIQKNLHSSGMDNASEMLSWYVFEALSLYPYAAVDDEYLVTVPIFDAVKWTPKGVTIKKKVIAGTLKIF